MPEIPRETSLTKLQQFLLLLISLTLAVFIIFLRDKITKESPLDVIARKSLLPEIALNNGRPTIIEFYADWCEVCKEMAPSILSLEKENEGRIDLVLLNVENPKWNDLLDKYEVNGVPQFNFFDSNGVLKGSSLGFRTTKQLDQLFSALLEGGDASALLDSSKKNNLVNKSSELNPRVKDFRKYLPTSHY